MKILFTFFLVAVLIHAGGSATRLPLDDTVTTDVAIPMEKNRRHLSTTLITSSSSNIALSSLGCVRGGGHAGAAPSGNGVR
jgi:hypothetical protein